jgi:mannose-6-phosphate isomerase-like protein (cupin superfamily)
MNDKSLIHQVEVLKWKGKGFRPLVKCESWIVALMNWEQRFDPIQVGDVERHKETDEVFVLAHGNSVLFIDTENGIRVFDMKPGVIYNVTKGTWHNVIGTKETTWLIVESTNTSSENTDHKYLTKSETNALKQHYPFWLK